MKKLEWPSLAWWRRAFADQDERIRNQVRREREAEKQAWEAQLEADHEAAIAAQLRARGVVHEAIARRGVFWPSDDDDE